MLYEEMRNEIIQTALTMLRYGLISLSGGNVAVRTEDGLVLLTPSAMSYEAMLPEDVVLVDPEGNTVDGIRRPSSDMKALLYIFRNKPEVRAVIHTHQPYATAVGLIEDELPGCLVGVLDACGLSSDEGMGKLTVDWCGSSRAVILRNHGVIAFGSSLDEALQSAVYLEEASRTYLAAKSAGNVRLLSPEQIEEEMRPRGNYRQP